MQAEHGDIFDSIQSGNIPGVKEFLDAGVPVNLTDEEGWSLLHHAAACGQVEVIHLLQESGCCVDAVDVNRRTPLHYAAANGFVKSVRALIEMGGDVNALDNEHTTPLQWAVMSEQYAVMEVLIEHGGSVDVDEAEPLIISLDLDPKTVRCHSELADLPVHNTCNNDFSSHEDDIRAKFLKAAQSGDITTVTECLDLGVPVDLTDEDGWSPVHHAIAHGQVEVIRLLMDRGCRMSPIKSRIPPSSDYAGVHNSRKCDIFDAARSGDTAKLKEYLELGVLVDISDEDGRTPLHCAAGEGQVDVVKLLIDKGCCIDPVDNNGLTPFMYADLLGHSEVQQLLSLVESVHRDSTGWTPLHAAAADGQLAVVKVLLNSGGKKLMTVVAGNSGTPLHQAAGVGHKDVVTLLLNEGCPVDIGDSNGSTALHAAAYFGQVHIIELLVKHGLDVNIANNMCTTALHSAAANGHLESVHTLLRLGGRGSLTMVADHLGTPLHQAASRGHKDVVTLLLDEGCPINIQGDNGSTALHIAAQCGQVEMCILFTQRGMDVNVVDDNWYTPLHSAAANGHFELVRTLLRLGGSESLTMVADGLATPLHQAAAGGHKDVVTLLLDEGCPIDTRDDNGSTALHVAAQRGLVDLCTLFKQQGMDVNMVDGMGYTPLHLAACHGQLESVRALLTLGGRRSMTIVAGDAGTPLHQAVATGHKSIVSLLLNEGCPVNVTTPSGLTTLHAAALTGQADIIADVLGKYQTECDVNAVDNMGATPLHYATRRGHLDAVRTLLRLGGRRSMSMVVDKEGTPLHLAIIRGYKDIVALLLHEGCPVNITLTNGLTALHVAAECNQVCVMEMLVKHGLDVNIEHDKGRTPLYLAAANGHLESVRTLLQLGGRKLMTAITSDGGSPLHQAAGGGYNDVVTLLVTEGCPVDIKDSDGSTALHYAAHCGQTGIIDMFTEHGLDVNIVDNKGWTPLHSASAKGQLESVRTLLRLGGKKSVTGELGAALHQAVGRGHKDVVSLLLNEGCPIDIKSSDGSNALHYAANCGQVDIIETLVERGLDPNIADNKGKTPLHSAANNGQLESVRTLFRLGGRRSMSVVADKAGTPLHQAAARGYKDVVEYFLRECDQLESADSYNTTALHFAAIHDKVDMIDFLLDNGYDVNSVDDTGGTPLHYIPYRLKSVHKLFMSGAKIFYDNFKMNVYDYLIVYRQVPSAYVTSFLRQSGMACDGSNFVDVITTLGKNNLIDINRVLCLAAVSGNIDLFDEIVKSDLPLGKQRMTRLVRALTMRLLKWHLIQNWLDELHILDDPLNPLHISLISCKQLGPGVQSTAQHKYAERVISHPRTKYTIHDLFPNGLSPLDVARQFELHDIAGMIERAGGRPGMWADLPKEMGQKSMEILRSLKGMRGSEFGNDSIRTMLRMLGYHVLEEREDGKDQGTIFDQKPKGSQVQKYVLCRINEITEWRGVGELLHVDSHVLDRFGEDVCESDNSYFFMLKYWLEHGQNVSWKTLLNALGHFETKKTMEDIRKKLREIPPLHSQAQLSSWTMVGCSHSTAGGHGPYRQTTLAPHYTVTNAYTQFSSFQGDPTLTEANLWNLVGKEMHSRWKEFAVHLHVETRITDVVYKQCLAVAEDCFVEVTGRWLCGEDGTGDLPRTWETVCDALSWTRFPLLAKDARDTLSKEHLSGRGTPHSQAPPEPHHGSQKASARTFRHDPTLTEANLWHLVGKKMHSRWKEFAVHLHVETRTIDVVYKQCLAIVEECFLEVTCRWLCGEEGTGDLPRTWETVFEALKLTGYPLLVKDVKEELSLEKFAGTMQSNVQH